MHHSCSFQTAWGPRTIEKCWTRSMVVPQIFKCKTTGFFQISGFLSCPKGFPQMNQSTNSHFPGPPGQNHREPPPRALPPGFQQLRLAAPACSWGQRPQEGFHVRATHPAINHRIHQWKTPDHGLLLRKLKHCILTGYKTKHEQKTKNLLTKSSSIMS